MKNNWIRRNIPVLLALSLIVTMLGTTACKKKDDIGKGTPESTIAPASDVNELFAKGDKEYFVPFQNPEHSYCTISDGLGVPVRQQGTGGCYAYATVTAIQTNYLKKHGELIDFNPIDVINRIYSSVDDLNNPKKDDFSKEKYYVSGTATTELGGDVERCVGALCADPLNGYFVVESNMCYYATIDEMKAAILEYGAIVISVNYQKACKDRNGYRTQNYDGTDYDHVVTIVGWDDDFPADGFVNPASQNGAWFVQNSFGVGWGNNGYYWISYDQPIDGFCTCEVSSEYSSALSYGRYPESSVPSKDAMSHYSEETGWNEYTAEEVNSWDEISVATVYEKKGSLAAIGFWSYTPNQPYTIEIRDGEFGDVLATKSGSFSCAGYHTVELDAPLSVKKFTVVLTMPAVCVCEGTSREGSVSTFAARTALHYEAQTKAGRSFIEIDGEWVDITDPDIMSRLGVGAAASDGSQNTTGDPCITVLFK